MNRITILFIIAVLQAINADSDTSPAIPTSEHVAKLGDNYFKNLDFLKDEEGNALTNKEGEGKVT